MPRPIKWSAVVLFVGAIVAAACGKSSPAAPTVAPSNAAPVRLTIAGPVLLEPGQRAGYTALATLSDGAQQDYTQKVFWSAGPASVLSMASGGQGTAGIAGDAKVRVSGTMGGTFLPLSAVVDVLVLPSNTYRLTGRVTESGLGVADAAVTVATGIGAGLTTKTGYDGDYSLYGVAGTIGITVRKDGYDPVAQTVSITANDVRDVDIRQTIATPDLAGPYTLTIAPDGNCAPAGNLAPFPTELRGPRSYPAVVTQDGLSVVVTVVSDGFSPPTDRFSGRSRPNGIDFFIGTGYYGYGPANGLSVRLSATTVLSYGGAVLASRSGSTLSGWFRGVLEVYEGADPSRLRLTSRCLMDTHRLTLTAASRSQR